MALNFRVPLIYFVGMKKGGNDDMEFDNFKLFYLHILLPTAKHIELIWRVLRALLTIEALPASESEGLVLHGGFETSRKNPGTVIEIFRDNLNI